MRLNSKARYDLLQSACIDFLKQNRSWLTEFILQKSLIIYCNYFLFHFLSDIYVYIYLGINSLIELYHKIMN